MKDNDKTIKNTMEDLGNLIEKEEPGFLKNITYLYPPNEDEETPPVPLSSELPLNYKFPVDSLGKILAPLAKEMHRINGMPFSICGNSLLAATSFAAQSHANIFIYGRCHPISLFLFTVGKSGERKSTSDHIASRPIKEYEEEEQKKYEKDLNFYNQNVLDGKVATIKIEKPRESIILIAEPTYEGLVRTFDQGQPSLAIFSDEGGRFIGGHAMNADNKLKTTTGFCELWDGASISRVRVKQEESKKLYGKRLSFHLMIQPKLADVVFNDESLVDQGFLGRCLITNPESNMGNRPFIKENIFDSQHYKIYSTKIMQLLEKNKIFKEDQSFCLNPPSLYFSDAAVNILESFYNDIEKELHPKGLLYPISSFANKAIEHTCRIAGVLTILNNPDATSIEIDVLHDAIKLVNFYMQETQRLIGNPELNIIDASQKESNRLAQELLDWMNEKSQNDEKFSTKEFSIRNLLHFSPYKFRKKDVLQKLLSILVDYGWLKKHEKLQKWTLKNIQ